MDTAASMFPAVNLLAVETHAAHAVPLWKGGAAFAQVSACLATSHTRSRKAEVEVEKAAKTVTAQQCMYVNCFKTSSTASVAAFFDLTES